MIHALLVIAFVATHLSDALSSQGTDLSASARWAAWLCPMAVIAGFYWVSTTLRCRKLDSTGQVRYARKALTAGARARTVAVLAHVAAVLTVDPLGLVRGVVGDLLVVDEFVATLPVLAVVIWTWWVMFAVEHRLEEASLLGRLDRGEVIEAMPTRLGSTWAKVRQDMLFIVVPVVLLMGLGEAVGMLGDAIMRADPALRDQHPAMPPAPEWTEHLPQTWRGERAAVVLSGPVLVAGACVILGLFPLAIRGLWDTFELEPGPFRDRIEARIRACGVRVSSLRVWRTRASSAIGSSANAAVVGFVRPLRDMLFTERLLEGLSVTELEAVVGHEAAHLRQHHAIWLAAAVLGIGSSVGLAAALWLGEESMVAGGAGIAAALLAVIVISRRFEWQADAHAARWLTLDGLEGAALLASALHRVSVLNGVSPSKRSWRHGSIQLRCERLRKLAENGVERLSIDRAVLLIRVIIVCSGFVATWLAMRSML